MADEVQVSYDIYKSRHTGPQIDDCIDLVNNELKTTVQDLNDTITGENGLTVLNEKVTKVNTAIYDSSTGLEVRVQKVEQTLNDFNPDTDGLTSRVEDLEEIVITGSDYSATKSLMEQTAQLNKTVYEGTADEEVPHCGGAG